MPYNSGRYTPVSGTNHRRAVVISTALIIAIGLIVGAFWLGRSTAQTRTDARNNQGGLPMHSGIPIPGRHSIAGAATAAANYQIAGFKVAAGTLDSMTAAGLLLAPNASDSARQVLAPPSAPASQLAKARTSYAPLSLVVQTYNGSHAVVQVWGVAANSSQITPQPAGTEDWGRANVTLVWTGARWCVTDQHYTAGPWPARDIDRMADSDGDFAFRYSELTSTGWSYVSEP